MQYGAAYPTTEVAGDPDAIRAFVKAAEELGYAHIMAYDHVVKTPHEGRDPPLTGPYTENHSFHDPFVLFGFAAGLTDKLNFVTGVLCLPQRQTALVAQQAADVDLLSRERLRLGVGIGWNYVEFAALGANFKTRAKRTEEQIGLLRQLWTTPVVDFEGRFDRIDRGGINPRPRRQIPIWLGGSAEASLDRAARLGDGFVFGRSGPAVAALAVKLAEKLAAAGRKASAFGLDAFVDYGAGPDAWRQEAASWAAAGGTLLSIRTMSTASSFLKVPASNFTTVDEHIGALEQFMTAVRS